MLQKDANSPGELRGTHLRCTSPAGGRGDTTTPRTLPSYPPFPSGRIKAIQPPRLLMVAVATARWEEQGGPDSDWSHSFQGSQCHPAWLFLQHFVGSSVGVVGWGCAGCSGTLPPSPSSPHSCCRGAQPGIPPLRDLPHLWGSPVFYLPTCLTLADLDSGCLCSPLNDSLAMTSHVLHKDSVPRMQPSSPSGSGCKRRE